MAEGSSTTATPSNQFVVKCIVHGHHVYKHIWSPGALVSSLQRGQQTQQVCRGCSSEKQFNSRWSHPKGDNLHLPLLHQEQREITGEVEDDSAAQQLVEVWKYHAC